MDTKTTIIAVVILAALVAFVLFRILSNKNKEQAKQEALAFLNTLADKFQEVIITHLKDIDIKHLDNLTDIEKNILNDTINELWQIVQDQLTTYATSESTKQLIRIIIDKEFLLNFIKQFFKKDEKVQKAYATCYNAALEEKVKQGKIFEEEVVKQNFEYETIDPSKVEKAEKLDPDKIYDYSSGKAVPIEKEIIPEKDITDEELTYSTEDESVEVLDDNTSEELKKKIEEE